MKINLTHEELEILLDALINKIAYVEECSYPANIKWTDLETKIRKVLEENKAPDNWKYAGISLNPEHFETYPPEKKKHKYTVYDKEIDVLTHEESDKIRNDPKRKVRPSMPYQGIARMTDEQLDKWREIHIRVIDKQHEKRKKVLKEMEKMSDDQLVEIAQRAGILDEDLELKYPYRQGDDWDD